jgi:hypothetical protein
MELLVLVGALVMLDLAAVWFGVDSRPMESERIGRSG